LEKRVNPPALQSAGPARGIIHPGTAEQNAIEHERVVPAAGLSPWIRHFWWVKWDLKAPAQRENLPHPSVHLTFEEGRAEIVGVVTRRFQVQLEAQGWVLGAKFEPGAFSSFAGMPVSKLTDRRVRAQEVFADALALAAEIAACASMEDRITHLSRYFQNRPLLLSEEARLAGALVRRLEGDRTMLRVEDLCREEGISVRRLQRIFQRHVGVSAKWVICRYRIHEALVRLEEVSFGERKSVNWAELALELGYYDQPHFINDFVSMVGVTPEQYERRISPPGRLALA